MNTTPFLELFIPLTAALGLSVVVERILEFLQNVFETIPLRSNTVQVPGAKSPEEVSATAEIIREYDKSSKLSHNDEQPGEASILVEPAKDPDNGKAFKKCILMLLGFAVGILLAFFADLKLFREIIPGMGAGFQWLDHIFTGLLIGGGSAPVHSIINFITERKSVLDVAVPQAEEIKKDDVPVKTEVKAITPPGVSIIPAHDIYAWVDIPYDGGVEREALAHMHLRAKDPDCIVFHHTAMHSDSTFQDVVNVIKAKQYDVRRVINGKTVTEKANWLTGYHCVILADGSIHPFCRWDRTGIHAGAMNGTSLGIAFNGNFETNPRLAGANINNRLGLDRPTEAQLRSGARVIALWLFLYDIPYRAELSKVLIPHNKVNGAGKVCPGSNFPYAELERLVRCYCNAWNKNGAGHMLEEYKMKPYLFKPKKEAA